LRASLDRRAGPLARNSHVRVIARERNPDSHRVILFRIGPSQNPSWPSKHRINRDCPLEKPRCQHAAWGISTVTVLARFACVLPVIGSILPLHSAFKGAILNSSCERWPSCWIPEELALHSRAAPP